jgi:hypothetical protein
LNIGDNDQKPTTKALKLEVPPALLVAVDEAIDSDVFAAVHLVR